MEAPLWAVNATPMTDPWDEWYTDPWMLDVFHGKFSRNIPVPWMVWDMNIYLTWYSWNDIHLFIDMSKKNHMRFVEIIMLKHSMECLKVAQTLTFLMVRWSWIELSWQTLRVATLLEPPNLWFSASCRSSWGFPKMGGFPNKPMGFSYYKWSFWGVKWGYHHLKKHSYVFQIPFIWGMVHIPTFGWSLG